MKKILTMLITVSMLFSLAACGGEEAPSTNEPPRAEQDSGGFQKPEQKPSGNVSEYDANSVESMIAFVENQGELAANNMEITVEQLLDTLGDTYVGYSENKALVTDFYNNSLREANELYSMFQTCSMDYFVCVSEQGLDDYDKWDDALSDFYNAWEDAMGDYYDAWDDAYGDLYDRCDDLISDAADTLNYEEYSNAWSSMYKEYSNGWGAMYQGHSDAWSKTYSDYSAVWGGFFNEIADVDAILKAAEEERTEEGESTVEPPSEETNTETKTEDESAVTDENTAPSVVERADGIRPEFKATMDSYEAFFDEYVEFMNTYMESDDVMSMMSDYLVMMQRYTEAMQGLESIDEEEMSTEEALYYTEVTLRISQKLLAVGG